MLIPRDYQQEAIDATWKFLHSDKKAGFCSVPTAGGKSLIQAVLIQRVLSAHADSFILCVAPNRDLVEQNSAELCGIAPDLDYGIYCAGLGQKDLKPLTFGTVQSLYRAKNLPDFEIVFIDEVHLCGKSTKTYMALLKKIWAVNPNAKIIGLSATPFRTDSGDIRSEGIFTNCIYEVDILRLLDAGHLCPIRTKTHPTEQVDTSQLKIIRGEFESMGMQRAFTEPAKFNAYMSQMATIYQSGQRNKFLIFGVSREHCRLMQAAFKELGIDALYCDGDTPKKERNAIVEKFRAAKRGMLINCALYTTGFNVRDVDCLAMVRATQSPVLFIQIIGRIMRTHPSKKDGLFLDYGKNTERFGPINLIKVAPKFKSVKEKGKVATTKICTSCGEYNALANKECAECHAPFPVQDRTKSVTRKASEADIIQRHPLVYNVDSISYTPCKSQKGIEMLKIQYYCGIKTVPDYLLLEHPETVRKHARAKWLSLGGKAPSPMSVKQAYERKKELLIPSQITVKRDGNFLNVIARKYATPQELLG